MKRWTEVWIDSASGGYVLLLRSDQTGRLEVTDPQEAGKVVRQFANYEEAVHWLNEDEYDLVEGRWTTED